MGAVMSPHVISLVELQTRVMLSPVGHVDEQVRQDVDEVELVNVVPVHPVRLPLTQDEPIKQALCPVLTLTLPV